MTTAESKFYIKTGSSGERFKCDAVGREQAEFREKLLKNGMHGILAVHIFLFSGKNKVKFTFFRKWTDGQ